MDVVGGLTLLVSLLLGVLLALLIDSYTLGRRLQAAVSQNGQLQQKLRQLAARLVSTQREAQTAKARTRQLGGDLAEARGQIEQVTAGKVTLRKQVETAAAEITTLQGNLSRLDDYVEQLESQSQSESQELEEAREWAGQARQLQLENQELTHKAHAAESRVEELKAQVKSLLSQLGETQSLHKQLVAAEDNVRAAEAQVHTLRSKLSSVRQVLEYTGKNQLRLIRGIGPTYARRLNEAGIHTLNDLARQSPERLREIVELKQWQAVEPEEWIDEAQALSVKLDGEGVQPATADSAPATDPWQNAQ